MSNKKLAHSNSLLRKCFARSNLQLDFCTASMDQASRTPSTPEDPTPALALITVENADNSPCAQTTPQRSPKPKRKHASSTLSSPPHITPQFPSLSHSTSGSSIDSGVGLSRASSLSSLPSGSKRPSRDSCNAVDIGSPLVESQRSLSTNKPGAKAASIVDIPIIRSRSPHPPSDSGSGIIDEPTRILHNSQSQGRLLYSGAEDDIGDLTQRTHRLSISRDAVEDLQTAVRRLLDDLQQQPQAEQLHMQGYLNTDFKSSDQDESDGPYRPKRRHSSAGLHIPLTQRQSRQVERKRSDQPFFHRSMEEGSTTTPRRRKPSACIVCERKHREPTMSAECVFVKTARLPDHRKQRRYSEVLKVCTPNDIPYTEVRLMSIEELRQSVTDTKQLPRRQARSLPRTLFPRGGRSQLKLPDVVRDEQLQFILERNMPEFLQYTNWNILFGHLVSKQLLSNECREILLCPLRTSIDKGNYFYGQVLPRMGRESEAFIKLYQCLEETRDEQKGHGDLLDIIDKGLHRYFYDKYMNVLS